MWYTSPFRPGERTPSFKIDAGKNVWYDFGMGRGGTIIDFVRCLYRADEVSKALAIIADVSGDPIQATAYSVPVASAVRERPIIESVGGIVDRTLEAYVCGRAIPLDLARLYLQEIRYRVGEREYKALAFANDS
ncbi:MAG: hypothetical protein ACYC2R_08585 [Burkholderiales bacterium]